MTYGSFYEITNPLSTVAKQHMTEWFSSKDEPTRWNITTANSGSSEMEDGIDGGLKMETGTTNASYVQMDFNNKRPFSRDGCNVVWIFRSNVPSNATAGTGWNQLGIGSANGNSGSIFFVTAGVHSSSTAHQFSLRTMRSESFSTVDTTMANNDDWHTVKVNHASDGGATGGSAKLWIDGVMMATCSTNLQSSALMQPITYTSFGNDGVAKELYVR